MRTRKVRRPFIIILLLLFLSVLGYSIYEMIDWYVDGTKVQKAIEDQQQLITDDDDEEVIVDENKIFEVDFNKLKEKNNEVVGFVKVNNTNIEYSVVKHNDNAYYLNHSFDKSLNRYGWIFANYQNKFDGTDRNITLFGHNMKNGSMFGTLKKVLTEEWQNNPENLKILFSTPEGTYTYEVFSTYKVYKEEYFAKSTFKDDNEFMDFVNTIKKRSNKDYGVTVLKDAEILTLSTCHSNNNYRVILHAKKMSETE